MFSIAMCFPHRCLMLVFPLLACLLASISLWWRKRIKWSMKKNAYLLKWPEETLDIYPLAFATSRQLKRVNKKHSMKNHLLTMLFPMASPRQDKTLLEKGGLFIAKINNTSKISYFTSSKRYDILHLTPGRKLPPFIYCRFAFFHFFLSKRNF